MMDKWTELAWNVFTATGDINSYLNYKKIPQTAERKEEQTYATAWSAKREQASLR